MNKVFKDSSKNKRKIKIFIVFLVFALLLVTATATAEHNNDEDNLDLVLGTSSSSGEIAVIEQEGSLLEGDLRLVLGLSGEVGHVKMTLPDGKTQEKETEESDGADAEDSLEDGKIATQSSFATYMDEEDVALGQSEIEQYDSSEDKVDGSPNVTLGQSGTEQENKKVIFDAPVSGIYTFDFYDIAGVYMGQQTFIVGQGLFPDALTLKMLDESAPLNYRSSTMTAIFDYTPMLTGEKEVLVVSLPPYFRFTSTTPGGGDGYTVERKTLPLPVEFYSDTDSDILKTMPASQTNVQALVFSFSETAVNPISITITFNGTGDHTNLGRAMLAYGANPDKIPLRLTAKGASADGTKLVAADIIGTTSRIPDANGDNTGENHAALKIKQNPGLVKTANWGFNFKQNFPGLNGTGGTTTTTGGYALDIGAWHYPVYNLKFYLPHDDNLTTSTYNGTTVINGKTYSIVDYATRDNSLFIPSNRAAINQSYSFRPAISQSQMKDGDSFPVSDMLMSYSYMGVDYPIMVVATAEPVVMPAYSDTFGTDYNSETHISGLANRSDRLQETNDKYHLIISTAHDKKINPTYDDFVYTMEFPYEISPTKFYNMSTGQDAEQRYVLPASMEYYVYGDPNPRTLTASNYGNDANRRVVTFDGLDDSEHVQKVLFKYNSLPPATRLEYYFDAKNSRYHEDDTELPTSYDATIKTNISGTKVLQKDTTDAESELYSQDRDITFKLLRFDKEDSMFFGARRGSVANITNLFGADLNQHQNMGGAQWYYRRTTQEMKDYDGVKFYIEPKTDEDKDLLSLVTGLGTRRYVPTLLTSDYKVLYKTNLKTDWTLAVQQTMSSYQSIGVFDLAIGEYTTAIMVDMGTVYGDQLNYGVKNANDSEILKEIYPSTSPRNDDYNLNFWLTMDNSQRSFYRGVSGMEKPIDPAITYTLTGSTKIENSTAKHINEADRKTGEFFLNEGDATYKFNIVGATNFSRNAAFSVANYSTSSNGTSWESAAPYQGNQVRWQVSNNAHISSDPKFTYNYKMRFYFEVYNYIELTSYGATNLVSVEPASSETTLYVYEYTSTNPHMSPYLYGKVRADAPTNVVVPVFKASGISYVGFEDDYMSDVNGVPYYELAPFYKYNIQERPFPAEWNVDTTDLNVFSTTIGANLNIQIHTEDSISLQTYVDKALKNDGDFKHHQRDSLVMSAEMGNMRDAQISQYEAIISLSRDGETTETLADINGLPVYEKNEYTLFLREPIAHDASLANFTVTYYTDYAATTPITITASSPQSDFEKVKAIKIYFEQFPAKSTKIVQIPLRTDYEKLADGEADAVAGTTFGSPLSYIGAKSRKDMTGNFSVHEAKPFRFDSYSLIMNVRIDSNENGSLQADRNGVAKITVYYKDGSTSEVLYEQNSVRTQTFNVNHDVEKIVVSSTDENLYRLTTQKRVGVAEASNSDFPSDNTDLSTYGILEIDKQHLYSNTANMYDVGMIYVPTIEVAPISAKVAQTSTYMPIVYILNNKNSRPAQLVNYQKELILSPTDQEIADVSFTQDAYGRITISVLGKKRGTINYTYKIQSPLGPDYSYEASSTITVEPDYVPTATIQKAYENNGKSLDSTHTFDFNFYEKDSAGNKIYESKVENVSSLGTVSNIIDSTSGGKILAKGFTHYIEEVSKTGYNILYFSVKIDGVTTRVDRDLNGEFKFDIPANALSVAITAYNENTPTKLNVTKIIDSGSKITNNTQDFTIVIKDHLNNEVFNSQLKNNDTAMTDNMIFGRTYTVTETVTGDYELAGMSVEKAGSAVGNQPNSGNTYKFELGVVQDGATLVVKNTYPEGNGIKLTKLLDNAGAPTEDFEFELKRVDGAFTYIGKVTKATATKPATTVVWYDNGTKLNNIDSLPLGQYTIEETSSNKSFEFDKFTYDTSNTNITVSNGIATVNITATSPTVEIQVDNKVKTNGRVTVNKVYNPYDFDDEIVFNLLHKATSTIYTGKAKYDGTNYANGQIVVDKWYIGNSTTDVNGSLPLGEYELVELSSTHYDFDGFTSDKTLVDLGNDKVSFVISGVDTSDENEIIITATNELKTGKISVTKALTPGLISTAPGANKKFDFELYRWNGATSSADLVATQSITIDAGTLTGKTAEFTGSFEYGKYFVVEKDDTQLEYSLNTSTSTVLPQSASLIQSSATVLQGATLSFVADNEINKSAKEIEVYKQVLDAADASAQTTFTFSLKWNGTEIYTGSVQSGEAGAALGKKISWAKSGTHNNGILFGGNLSKLYYGEYTIEEVIPAGTEFMLKEINTTLGTANLGAKSLSFTINATTEQLPDYTATFINQYSKVKTANISKDFIAGSENIRKIDFSFVYREGNNTSTEKAITNVKDTNSAPTVIELERGKTYQIKEDIIAGYNSKGFEVVINGGTALTLTEVGSTGWYELVVPLDAYKAEIVAYNESVPASLTVLKEVAGINLDKDNAQFKVTIVEKDRPNVLIWEKTDLKTDESASVDVLVDGIEYIIKEVHNQSSPTYILTDMKIKTSGGGAVTDANLTHVSLDNTYTFKKTASGEGATITITNKMITGKGIGLTKHLPNGTDVSLDRESFKFEITSTNGFTGFGYVENTTTSPAAFPANVKWYFENDYSGTAFNLEDLPLGTYTIKEVGTYDNFEFDRFTDSSSTTVGSSSYTFTVSSTSVLQDTRVHNKVKSGGKITINKEYPALYLAGNIFEFTAKNLDSGVSYVATGNAAAGSTSVTIQSWEEAISGTTVTSLPVGKYQLTESSPGAYYSNGGFDANSVPNNTAAGLVLSGVDDTIATFTLSNTPAANRTNEVTVTAYNILGTGTIVINKEASGSNTNLPQDFFFDLYKMVGGSAVLMNPGNTPIKITVANINTVETLTLNNMPYGEYYLEEHVNDFFALQGNSNVSEKNAGQNPDILNILPGTATITFNAYNRSRTAEEAFFAYKHISEILPNEQETFEVELRYQAKTGPERVLYKGTAATDTSGQIIQSKLVWSDVNSQGNGKLSTDTTEISDLEHGKYTLREVTTGNSYTFDKMEGTLGTDVGNDWVFEINKDNTSSDLIFNVHNKPKEAGKVSVNKVVSGDNTFPDTVFTFELENISSGKKYTANIKTGEQITKWKTTDVSGVTTEVTNGSLPYGSYKLTETSAKNFELVKFENLVPAAAGTVTTTQANIRINNANKDIQVDVVNKVKSDGAVTINKQFDNSYNHNDSSEFTFLLFGPEVNGVMPTTGVPYKADKNGWTATASGLVYGKYLVQEDLSSTPEYELVSMSDGINPAVNQNGITFIVGEDINQATSASISVVNKVASTGRLVVKKEIEGENGNPDNTFTFKITDALGNEQTLTLKANEERTLSSILYGDVSIEESPEEDYDFTGAQINAGARVSTMSYTVPVIDAANPSALVSYSKNKTDGSLTVDTQITEELKQDVQGESVQFMLYKSLDKGATWTVVPPLTKANSVNLGFNESYTYNSLLRGAMYKVAASIEPTKTYQVRDIIPNASTVGVSDPKAGTFEFQANRDNLNSSVTYLLDIKRIDLGIYKYFLGEPNNPAPDATFTLLRFVDDRPMFYAKDKIDINGNLVFKGLPAGKYVVSESYAPRGYVVLQSNIYFTITHNMITGELDVNLSNSKYAAYENGIISVPNDWKLRDSSSDGSDMLDGNSLLLNKGDVVVEEFEDEVPDVTPNKLPQAGGLPLSYISFAGMVVIAAGALVEKKKRKKDKKKR